VQRGKYFEVVEKREGSNATRTEDTTSRIPDLPSSQSRNAPNLICTVFWLMYSSQQPYKGSQFYNHHAADDVGMKSNQDN